MIECLRVKFAAFDPGWMKARPVSVRVVSFRQHLDSRVSSLIKIGAMNQNAVISLT